MSGRPLPARISHLSRSGQGAALWCAYLMRNSWVALRPSRHAANFTSRETGSPLRRSRVLRSQQGSSVGPGPTRVRATRDGLGASTHQKSAAGSGGHAAWRGRGRPGRDHPATVTIHEETRVDGPDLARRVRREGTGQRGIDVAPSGPLPASGADRRAGRPRNRSRRCRPALRRGCDPAHGRPGRRRAVRRRFRPARRE